MTRLNDRAIHEGKSNKVIFDHLEKKKNYSLSLSPIQVKDDQITLR